MKLLIEDDEQFKTLVHCAKLLGKRTFFLEVVKTLHSLTPNKQQQAFLFKEKNIYLYLYLSVFGNWPTLREYNIISDTDIG